jgi:hypothetical protein
MAIDGARIQRVTKEGLFYLDDEGEEVFISFALCHLNYVMEFVDRSQSHSREKRQEEIQRRREWKCVADRSFDGYPLGNRSYFEFYTKPPLLIDFATEEEFRAVQIAMGDYGWHTFDRT